MFFCIISCKHELMHFKGNIFWQGFEIRALRSPRASAALPSFPPSLPLVSPPSPGQQQKKPYINFACISST
jgi:hypothetical protein